MKFYLHFIEGYAYTLLSFTFAATYIVKLPADWHDLYKIVCQSFAAG